MEDNKVRRFVELIRLYNSEPNKRVFRVDRDCYIITTIFSSIDDKPFLRIGYSDYIEKFKKDISSVVIAPGYISSLRKEIEQMEEDKYNTNFILPSSIYNVILKYLPSSLHHKINVNVIDRNEVGIKDSEVVKEISEKYKTYVLLYDNGNFAITFGGKKVFDLFSALTNDLTTSKILNLLSPKLYEILPINVVINIGGNYVIRSKSKDIMISTDEFDEKEFLKTPIPLTTVRSIVGNNVISLIDTIRLIYDRSSLRVFTNKEIYEDFKRFNLGIKFVEISDKIDIINNVNITTKKGDGKYSIPLVSKEGVKKELVFGSSTDKNVILLQNLEYILLEDFSKGKVEYISTNLITKSPEDNDYDLEFSRLKDEIKEKFDKKMVLSDVHREFDKDNVRIKKDRERLEELVSLYEYVSSLPYSERVKLIVKSEKLEGTKKEEEIIKLAEKSSKTSPSSDIQTSSSSKSSAAQGLGEGKSTINLKQPVSSETLSSDTPKGIRKGISRFNLKHAIVGLGVLIVLTTGILFLLLRDEISNWFLTEKEREVIEIISNLDNTYEPELTHIQTNLGITITDYDIWIYVNKVAVLNGYKPLTYRNPQKWEDPDWVYPNMSLKMVDGSIVIVRTNDNMWNISKRKIIEDYIKKKYNVRVESRAGTNVYSIEKK
ncbi:MAG: hypothetical protein RMJ37_06355 [Spirochaetia bacterium]|nr:hypothetical protein [Spirochaetota bacterium]MDW8112935.1 hypothetical protein [Spirochaetia bacterium]